MGNSQGAWLSEVFCKCSDDPQNCSGKSILSLNRDQVSSLLGSLFICLSLIIRGTRSVERNTVDLPLDSVVLLSWICNLSLSPGEQAPLCAGWLAHARLAVRAVLSRETLLI